ncbi:hypothetical protein ACOMHN_047016 [Nucella lapillus]
MQQDINAVGVTLTAAPALAFTSGNETLLRSQIFTGYDSEVRPDDVTQILLQFIPTSMNDIRWNDSRLTWDPTQYDGVAETHVYQHEVWTPPIIVYNS